MADNSSTVVDNNQGYRSFLLGKFLIHESAPKYVTTVSLILTGSVIAAAVSIVLTIISFVSDSLPSASGEKKMSSDFLDEKYSVGDDKDITNQLFHYVQIIGPVLLGISVIVACVCTYILYTNRKYIRSRQTQDNANVQGNTFNQRQHGFTSTYPNQMINGQIQPWNLQTHMYNSHHVPHQQQAYGQLPTAPQPILQQHQLSHQLPHTHQPIELKVNYGQTISQGLQHNNAEQYTQPQPQVGYANPSHN